MRHPARPGCSTARPGEPDCPAITDQCVLLGAARHRPERRSDDGQMIFEALSVTQEFGSDLGFRGAPLRNRTVDLLLTIYPRADAVAICDDAAQVRGGARCCRPTYLVITRGPGGPDAAPLAGALAAVSPTAGHAVQPPPRGPGRNGRPPGHRGRRRPRPGPGTGQARQARCCSPAYLPTCPRQPGRPAQPARPAPEKPAQRTTAHRQHRTHPPDPAPQALRGVVARQPGLNGPFPRHPAPPHTVRTAARPRRLAAGS
jgi:hypothetical protein